MQFGMKLENDGSPAEKAAHEHCACLGEKWRPTLAYDGTQFFGAATRRIKTKSGKVFHVHAVLDEPRKKGYTQVVQEGRGEVMSSEINAVADIRDVLRETFKVPNQLGLNNIVCKFYQCG